MIELCLEIVSGKKQENHKSCSLRNAKNVFLRACNWLSEEHKLDVIVT